MSSRNVWYDVVSTKECANPEIVYILDFLNFFQKRRARLSVSEPGGGRAADTLNSASSWRRLQACWGRGHSGGSSWHAIVPVAVLPASCPHPSLAAALARPWALGWPRGALCSHLAHCGQPAWAACHPGPVGAFPPWELTLQKCES